MPESVEENLLRASEKAIYALKMLQVIVSQPETKAWAKSVASSLEKATDAYRRDFYKFKDNSSVVSNWN